ncbi:gamma-glutamyl hydrolase-like [Boleophthalmus pectinirostris]|uniref:gamma-glutamyl hydrolase-like n=1 Tax=Boleophthalmus pectinirostris TaxID=150288 RepID=UPI00242DBB88|nr:gamma-glutamyl hydrolase-like [Boleophthalmus pectinirostris]
MKLWLGLAEAPRRRRERRRHRTGLMAQDVKNPTVNEDSYIAASYVKTLESAGARVLPIMINRPEEEYRMLFKAINGFFLPGGAANIMDSGYATAANIFYDLAIEANKKGDYFPIWGTCLGFEQLAVITAKKRVLVRTNTTAVSLPLNFTAEANGSRLFKDFRPDVMSALATEPITINAHKWSVSMETYYENEDLNKFYKVLSTNTDGKIEFISTFEAYDYPFYGVQYHPEKNPYEWTRDFYVHTPISIRMTFCFADFFVNEARKSKHTYESEQWIRDLLIYHSTPTYTGETSSVFEQKYFYFAPEVSSTTVPAPSERDSHVDQSLFGGAVQIMAHVNIGFITAVVFSVILNAEMW